jgi:putative toxin-antitoxin system antitoxin component (TIGR02293 family)
MATKSVKVRKSKPITTGTRGPGGVQNTQGQWSKIYSSDLLAAGRKFQAVRSIESGLNVKVVDVLADKLELPAMVIRTLARISPSTFARRQQAGVLSPEESDRVYRMQSVVQKATDFYEGNIEAARRWLCAPAPALGGVRPLSMLGNEAGVREVESLLSRLEYGVFT